MLLNGFGGELDTWSAPGPTCSTGQTHGRIPDDLDGENAKTDDLRRIFGGLRARSSRTGNKPIDKGAEFASLLKRLAAKHCTLIRHILLLTTYVPRLSNVIRCTETYSLRDPSTLPLAHGITSYPLDPSIH